MGSHGGKRRGERRVEHSVIEAYKWPNFLRPIYKQAKKGNTNKDHGRGVLRNNGIHTGKLEKTIPHHGRDGWMGGGNGSQTQIKHCNRSKHDSIQFGLEKGKKYETSKLKVWHTMEWRLTITSRPTKASSWISKQLVGNPHIHV